MGILVTKIIRDILSLFSAICICFGFQLGKSSTPDYAVYIMIVYVLYVIVFDIVFEIMECMSKKEKAGKYLFDVLLSYYITFGCELNLQQCTFVNTNYTDTLCGPLQILLLF